MALVLGNKVLDLARLRHLQMASADKVCGQALVPERRRSASLRVRCSGSHIVERQRERELVESDRKRLSSLERGIRGSQAREIAADLEIRSGIGGIPNDMMRIWGYTRDARTPGRANGLHGWLLGDKKCTGEKNGDRAKRAKLASTPSARGSRGKRIREETLLQAEQTENRGNATVRLRAQEAPSSI